MEINLIIATPLNINIAFPLGLNTGLILSVMFLFLCYDKAQLRRTRRQLQRRVMLLIGNCSLFPIK